MVKPALSWLRMLCHIPDLNDIAKGAYNLLNDKGVLIFEDPYLGDMLEKVFTIKFMTSMFIYKYQFKIFGRHGLS